MRVDVPHARGINVTKLLYLKGSCWLLGTNIVPTNCVASRKTPRNRWCDVYIGFYFACLDVVKNELLFQRNKMATLQSSQCVAFSQVHILLHSNKQPKMMYLNEFFLPLCE